MNVWLLIVMFNNSPIDARLGLFETEKECKIMLQTTKEHLGNHREIKSIQCVKEIKE
jgi:hypothetical protein